MKKSIQQIAMIILVTVMMVACDNGFSDVPIVDNAPSISLGTITSGTTEGEDFKINVTVKDAQEGSKISQLGLLEYVITKGGTATKSGSEALTGWSQTVSITIPKGFSPGDYNLDVTVSDSNGNKNVANQSFKVAPAKPAFDITGVWTMAPVARALAVGPAPGDGQWFSSSAADVVTRACFFDDKYTFKADGTFTIDLGSQTWLETWQGVGVDGCGTPVAPYNGGNFTYTYTSAALTLIGKGAHVGLAKVNNAGEIPNVPAPDQISYTIVDQTKVGDTRNMTLRIQAGNGVWWDFKLISGASPAASIVGNWKMEPVEGAFAVGSSEGNNDFFFNKTADVTARACFFDDVYTFAANGNFSINMGGQTWLETWQGVGSDACGVPVAPHDGAGAYTYSLSGGSLKLIGKGAHLALPKVVNGGELPTVAVPNDVTYKVVSLTTDGTKKRMTLHIEVGGGAWWTFKLISE